jgi:endonuclease-3 related protein
MSSREALLHVKGIGAETADSILLYGGNHPVFVVDTYTHRIFSRHQLVPEECDYQSLQDLFMDNLEHDPSLFNEYHALIVKTGHLYCKKNKPLCETCPLREA